ncbi:hypothetical protein GOB93_00130 [Acetobacter musti]|uniref:Sulfotransferase family protein n=1 Tax=Acetobacter musti TaxID=864732 RepID=A0ABX0JMI7_9PROT|nr:hypothetical protein [Acetobacter musti]NHN83060.1 hypothetical protein [Acetobacter musti]
MADDPLSPIWPLLLGREPTQAEREAEAAREPADSEQTLARRLMLSDEFAARLRQLKKDAGEISRTVLAGRRLAFVHIEKCGGSTLHAMLASQFPPERICPERFDALGCWTINELSRYDLFSGHFDLAYCRSIPGTVQVITMLREPRARLMSLWRFWRAHRETAATQSHPLVRRARTMDAETFFSDPVVIRSASVRDAITGQLIRTGAKGETGPDDILITNPEQAGEQAWTALRAMTAFGLVERMEESRLLINDATGLAMQPVAPLQVLNDLVRNEAAFVKPPEEPMTPALLARLDALTRADRALYARAVRLFARRYAILRLRQRGRRLLRRLR